MDAFLEKFFYAVYENKKHAHENNYCKYNNQGLAAFTSSLYPAGLVATLVASPITRNYGRRASIICGGISFLVGAALNATAINLAMLLLGRIMLGIGIGFGNQVVFCYFMALFDINYPYSISPKPDLDSWHETDKSNSKLGRVNKWIKPHSSSYRDMKATSFCS